MDTKDRCKGMELPASCAPCPGLRTGQRHHGIDLLRILAMFMVCVMHVNLTSGSLVLTLYEELPFRLGVLAPQSVCLIAVNLYAMVTGYVCVNGLWKLGRYLRLWMQVAFYVIGYYALREVLCSCGVTDVSLMDGRDWLSTFLPIPFASAYWYFTAYTVLFLLIPFINPMLKACSRARLGALTLLLCVLAVFVAMEWGSLNALILICLYVLGAYIRLYPLNVPKPWLCLAFLVGVLMSMMYSMLTINVLASYVLPSNMVAAVCVFLFVERLEVKNPLVIRLISLLAPLSFGVYLAHVHPWPWAMMHMYMPTLFKAFDYAWWLFLLCPVLLYAVCSLVDAGRAGLFRLCRVDVLVDALDRLLQKCWYGTGRWLQKHLGTWLG